MLKIFAVKYRKLCWLTGITMFCNGYNPGVPTISTTTSSPAMLTSLSSTLLYHYHHHQHYHQHVSTNETDETIIPQPTYSSISTATMTEISTQHLTIPTTTTATTITPTTITTTTETQPTTSTNVTILPIPQIYNTTTMQPLFPSSNTIWTVTPTSENSIEINTITSLAPTTNSFATIISNNQTEEAITTIPLPINVKIRVYKFINTRI